MELLFDKIMQERLLFLVILLVRCRLVDTVPTVHLLLSAASIFVLNAENKENKTMLDEVCFFYLFVVFSLMFLSKLRTSSVLKQRRVGNSQQVRLNLVPRVP